MKFVKWDSIIKTMGLIAIVLFFAAPLAQARTESHIRTRNVTGGDNHFEMKEYFNQHGEYEIRVYLKQIRRFAPDNKKLILIGRAINVPEALIANLPESQHLNPKIITTWFVIFPTRVIRPIEYVQTTNDPWPAAYNIIQNNISTEYDWYTWVLLEKFATTVSIACSSTKTFFDELVQEQLTLYDLEIRLNHLAQINPRDPFLLLGRRFVVDSWADMVARIDKHMNQDTWANLGADVGITLVGGKLVTLGYKGVSQGAARVSQTQLGVNLATQFRNLRTGVSERVSSATQRLVRTNGRVATEVAARYTLSALTLQQKTIFAVSYLQSKSVIARVALDSAGTLLSVAKAGLYQSRYVGMVAGIQLGAETLARPEDLFDRDPLVMIEKLSQDEQLIQNMAYMSNETFWMAGVATHFASSSLKKRLALCATVALVNSIGINLLVGGEPDPQRIAVDTSWESVVGNVQTQIDMRAMQYFEGLAERSVNPRLRFAGYALAVVSKQGAGYYGYAEVTHLLESRSNPAPTLVNDFENPKVILVPIMTDEATYEKIARNNPV